MNGERDIEGMRAAREAAADWFARLQADEADEADWRAFHQWLKADPLHQPAYESVEALWIELDEQAVDVRARLAPPPATPLRPRARRSRPLWPILATAGALAAGIAVAVFVVPAQRPTGAAVDYATAKGEMQLVALADGSKVRLNSGSRIQVRLDRDARRVTMGDAEAAFDVAKDPGRPFLIAAGDRTIRVVGTEFDVLNHGGRFVVTVRRGVVEVGPADDGAAQPVRLAAGQQLSRDDGGVSVVRTVDPDIAFAWRERRLIYQGQSLGLIVEDLNRYFATPIRVEGSVTALKFSGVLMVDGEDAVVRRLEAFLPVSAERRPGEIVLRERSTTP